MKPRKAKNNADRERKSETNVQTPPPPQVLDPSMPPGQGQHETYGSGDNRPEKDKKKADD